MSESEHKIIFSMLIIILILSGYLIIKIKLEPKYDKEVYSEIYNQYEEIFPSESTELYEDTSSSNEKKNNITRTMVDAQGNKYKIAGKIRIDKIKITYPIITETTLSYLKVAPTKFCGPEVNKVGNLCIVAHNYKNDQFFSRISELEKDDKVYLTSNDGTELEYLVYDKFEIEETDMSCTNQETKGKIELTLITCTKKKQNRLVVKCRANI